MELNKREIQVVLEMCNNVDVKGLVTMQAVLDLAIKCKLALEDKPDEKADKK